MDRLVCCKCGCKDSKFSDNKKRHLDKLVCRECGALMVPKKKTL